MSHMYTPAINAQCLKDTVLALTLSLISCGSFFIVKRACASESIQLQPMMKPTGHHKWASDESIRVILHLLHYWKLLEGKTNMSRVLRGLQWEPIKESHFSLFSALYQGCWGPLAMFTQNTVVSAIFESLVRFRCLWEWQHFSQFLVLEF